MIEAPKLLTNTGIRAIAYLLLVFVQNLPAQSWKWGRQGNTGLKTEVFAKSVATNKLGNVYHTGDFKTSLTFATYTLSSSSNSDLYLVKYDKSGNIKWAKQSITTGSSLSSGFSVTSDSADNAYVTGVISAGTLGAFSVTQGMFLAKFDSLGNVVWVVQPSSGAPSATGFCVSTDGHGNELVSGRFGGALTLGTFNLNATSAGPGSAFLAKYDNTGNVIWAVQSTGSAVAVGSSVAVDLAGDAYVTGNYYDSNGFHTASVIFGTFTLTPDSAGIFLVKYDNNGNVIWANQSASSYSTPAGANQVVQFGNVSVTTDGSDAAYIAGTYADTIKFGQYTLSVSGMLNTNSFLVKYAPNGNIIWAKQGTPINNSLVGYSISSDAHFHIYISGTITNFAGNNPSMAFGNDTLSSMTSGDLPSYLIKCDSSGKAICGSLISGGGRDPNAVASDTSGNYIFLGGMFIDVLVLLNDTSLVATGGGEAPFVARWLSCPTCTFAAVTSVVSNITCNGLDNGSAAVTLSGSSGDNYSYSWSNGSTSATINNLGISQYMVTVTDVSGCSETNSLSITQPNALIASANVKSNATCGNKNGEALASGTGGTGRYSYRWNNLLTDSVDSNLYSGTYVITVTDVNGCSSVSTVTINNSIGPNLSVIDTVNTCAGKSDGIIVVLASGGSGNLTYVWNNGFSGKIQNNLDAGIYSVTVTDENGCTAVTSASIKSLPIPLGKAGNDTTIYPGANVQLWASGGTSYLWSPSGSLSNVDISNPTANPSQTTLYTVMITGSNSCSVLEEVQVRVNENNPCDSLVFFVPTAFSPNGDGKNDVLRVHFNEVNCIADLRLKIYDRWGEEVFSSENPTQGWNGFYRGRTEGMGVFTYYITGTLSDGKTIAKKGNVSLVR